MRTSTISSISYINDRNRKRNVEQAEKAILVTGNVSDLMSKYQNILFIGRTQSKQGEKN